MPKNFLTYIICKNENNGQAFAGTFTLRLYTSYNHTHTPDQHVWQSPTPSAQLEKQWKQNVHVQG